MSLNLYVIATIVGFLFIIYVLILRIESSICFNIESSGWNNRRYIQSGRMNSIVEYRHKRLLSLTQIRVVGIGAKC